MSKSPPAESQPPARSTRVAIVGAGPIGLELAVALRRHDIDFEVFDAGSIGNTISWWAPQTRWFSSNERIAIAGVPLLTADQSKATREHYLTYLRGVATQFEIQVHTHCPVVNIARPSGGRFAVTTKPGGRPDVWSADAVVLAIGGTDFPKKLGIPGEDLPHVDGYLRETHRYFGRDVLIIGGRNSAIEAALRLHHAGANVSLSYRGGQLPEDHIKYWLLPEIKGLLAAGRIGDFVGTTPVQITPQNVQLQSIEDRTRVEVKADDVLSLIGYEQDKTLMRMAGVELTESMQRPTYDETTMETNVPGIYIAGTATAGTQSSKYKTFLENCHDHVDKIVAHLSGQQVDSAPQQYRQQILSQPES
ncbi:Ferredoxin--NADP reductase [Stieleria maiorica]|uniref:Ferredoxin--NADP reductase n=1 Tax=Stieleria maiorica TaxID=2795974 RepID=A0A5B9M9I1_9BACT|nr:NAD(P)-binding domain-containing protein [Stieleria maiorica]QEF96214.1 Ferredoxin--NADP reductase [Stieleria maiorica]